MLKSVWVKEKKKWCTSLVRPVGCFLIFLCPLGGEWKRWIVYLLAHTCVCQPVILNETCTYRAAIRASCSAALMAASSSSLDIGLVPFLSFAYHVRSLPFCHRPTGAIKEFPRNKTEEFRVVETDVFHVLFLHHGPALFYSNAPSGVVLRFTVV